MKTKTMTDAQIIETLKTNNTDKAFIKLYEYFPKVEKLILTKGGTKNDAEDIYQEALILLCKKVRHTKFELTSAIGTYLYSVCRFMWSDELKRRKIDTHSIDIDLPSNEQEQLLEAMEKETRLQKAEQALMKLGEKCIQLLKMFYHESLRMKEIAKKLNFSSEKIAKNQKYKCLERARKNLRSMPQ